jgi:hypothetical protein
MRPAKEKGRLMENPSGGPKPKLVAALLSNYALRAA